MEESALPAAVVPGDILAGKYQVERVLGRGGMGLVVAARHKDLDELFAIKLLLPQAADNPQAVDRFLREARAAVRLKGEHVAKVTDVGRLDSGSPYIVMEHLSGLDLRRHLRMSGPLPVAEAVTHVLQACDAIAEAHANGIIHRDLKPANLFLTQRQNGTSCIKVLDFGISKHMTHEAVDITRTGEILGTPLYMAPEQMARMKDADARCDIWSLGVVLYELLTGTTPFHGTVITEIVARVLQEDAAPPSRIRADVPPALDAAVLRCLQKKPDQRFQTVVEMAAALRAVGAVGVDTGPRTGALADPGASTRTGIPAVSAGAAAAVPDTGTVHLSTSILPTHRLSSPGAAPPSPVANTSAAWGTTGPFRAPKRSATVGVVAALGAVAGVAGVLVAWMALRSPAAPAAEPSGPPAGAAFSAEPAPTGGVVVAPTSTEPPALSAAVTAVAAASGAPAGSAAASASSSAGTSGTPPGPSGSSKSTGKKTVSSPPPVSPHRFGGIR